MAAERICFSIAPGARQSHRLVCQPAPAEEGGAEGHGRLSRLEWSAVVLDEKLIDLEVHVILQPQEEGAGQGLEWLQQKASGRTFQGAFVPGEHPRLKQVPAERIESVIFEFDNSYSWFTAKDVELVVLRTDEDDGRPGPGSCGRAARCRCGARARRPWWRPLTTGRGSRPAPRPDCCPTHRIPGRAALHKPPLCLPASVRSWRRRRPCSRRPRSPRSPSS